MMIRRRDESVGYLVWKLGNLVSARVDASLDEIDLRVAQLGALLTLHERPQASSSDLARDMRMTPQNLSLIISRFSQQGWVQRSPHRTHGRILQLELTEKGEKLMQEGARRAEQVDHDMLAGFTDAERSRLRAMLQHCLDFMEAQVAHDSTTAAPVAKSDRRSRPTLSPRNSKRSNPSRKKR